MRNLTTNCSLRLLFLAVVACITTSTHAQFSETILATDEASVQSPIDAEIADFNQDGLLDVILADMLGNSSCVLYMNLGNRAFSNQSVLGEGFVEVQVGDVNNDGFPDILGVNQFNLVQVYINDGTGAFPQSISYSGGWANPEVIRLADLNGDGFLDFVLGSKNDGEVHVALNLQDGSFGTPYEIDTGHPGLRSITLADFNNDGSIDVAWLATNVDEVGWLANDGDGNFGPLNLISSTFDAGWELTSFDYNGDSDMDIIAIAYTGSKVSAFNNDGNGVFTEVVVDQGSYLGKCINHGQLSGDSNEDLIIGGGSNLVMSILPGLGGGNFGAHESLSPFDGQPTYEFGEIDDIEIADLDNDGEVDLLAVNQANRTIQIMYGPNFDGPALNLDISDFDSVDFNDIDEDGDQDLLVASNTTGLSIYINDGNQLFTTRRILPSQVYVSHAAFQDFDNDGDADIITRTNVNLTVVQNHGNLDFELTPIANSSNTSQHCVGDVDGDGDTDVFFVRSGSIWVSVNGGSFNFGVPVNIGSYGSAYDMAAGDINNDGLADIALCDYSGNKVSVFQNLGGTSFALAAEYSDPSTAFASGVKLADMNGDNLEDLIYSSYLADALIWRFNMGDGSFSNPQLIASLDGAKGVTIEDLDGDGDLDVMSGSVLQNDLIYALNNGFGNFSESQQVFTFLEEHQLTLVDFDSDGLLDLVYANLEEYYAALVDPFEFFGCADPSACNFFSEQATDDGSCCYGICGCMNPEACNYNENAECDDQSCVLPGCEDESACNYDPFALCFDTCYYEIDVCGECGGDAETAGCSDPSACNFLPNADCEAVCLYAGCTDPGACNYSFYAGCDDGSCIYIGSIGGYVFNDLNGNGIYDQTNPWIQESPMIGWQVEIEELGWVAFTNQDGYYLFEDLPYDDYTITLTNVTEGWSVLETYTADVTVDDCPQTQGSFPLGWEGGDAGFHLSAPCCVFSADIHCQNGFNPGLWIQNAGGVPLYGTVSVSYNPILQATNLNNQAVEPTLISPGMVTWTLDNSPLIGESELFQCHILGPGVDYIGQVFPVTIHLELIDDEGNPYFSEEWVLTPTVVCAYDPNDKYTENPGYTDENHFVLKEDEMEYRVRFQNTGNFPAQDVVIRDTLDIEHLDLSSFHPVFASHNLMTVVKPDGSVEFTFADIQLPDSTCCEPESQGYVVYRITPRNDVDPGDVIHNTAHIFFDGNPPIVTNTTWHTIYECSDALAEIEYIQNDICVGEPFEATSTQPYIEEYHWYVDDLFSGQGNELNIEEDDAGIYLIELEVENPLCVANSEILFEVHALPEIVISDDAEICMGETIDLNATVEDQEVWSLSVSPEESGSYSTSFKDEFGCTSEATVFIAVNPLPLIDAGEDVEICEGEEVLLEATGDGTVIWEGTESNTQVVAPEVSSTYTAIATTAFNCTDEDEVLVTVFPTPEIFIQQNGNQLYYAGFESGDFQWFLNGEPIDGATDPDISITEDGIYHLELTNTDGCLGVSEEIDAIWDSVNEHGIVGVNIYPNPVQDLLNIQFSDATSHTIELYNADGKLVHSATAATSTMRIDMQGFAKGIYTLKVVGMKNAMQVVH